MSLVQIRPIWKFPTGKDGLFKGEGADPVQEEHLRQTFFQLFQYSDNHCGNPRLFDPEGNYLCRGCNKFVEGGECLLVFGVISGSKGSCRHWENLDAGDPELDFAVKISKELADYGETELGGFGCKRCQYRLEDEPDSVGRDDICKQGNFHVADNGCCALNNSPGMKTEFRETPEEKQIEEKADSDPTPPEEDDEEEKPAMAKERWMSHEAEREKHAGTKGSFSRLAHRKGHSTHEEAELDKHKSGKVGQKARMALAFSAARHKK